MNQLTDPSGAVLALASDIDLLCLSHLRWNFVTQRPQHLLNRAAARRRVFYWEEPFRHADGVLPPQADLLSRTELGFDEGSDATFALEAMQEGKVTVLRPHFADALTTEQAAAAQATMLAAFLRHAGTTQYVAWYYTPMMLGFTEALRPAVTIYDCMDELSLFHGAPPELREREQQLLRNADVVFTGGMSLYESKRTQHPNVHAFPSSIDVAHFAAGRRSGAPVQEPADQACIPHPRAGFYGVIDERLDIELLRETAQLLPQVHFVMLGPVVKIDPATLPEAANLHYLAGKRYEDLPTYLAGWDVALLPFARNEATHFISPTKTPEYLAAGKPVVSTGIRDVIRGYGDEGLVAIADTPADFAAAIEAALQPQSDAWLEAVDRKLAMNSWDRTWAHMESEIAKALVKRSKPNSVGVTGARGASTLNASGTPEGVRQTVQHKEKFDYVIAGAGFAGSVLAERLATVLHKRVLVVDKRDHIAGNAYDFYDAAGVLVHKYGPHIFHTNSEKVSEYLSQFTEWRPYEHRVLASLGEELLPFPINIDTINQLYDLKLDAAGMEAFLAQRAIASPRIRTSKDLVLSKVGSELYTMFFQNYTRKQWGLDPSELDAQVAGRIPIRFDHDDRYFADTFQAMPLLGYTAMFERMLDHPNITVRTGEDFADMAKHLQHAKAVFTGPIDEYFKYKFGPLPYRSLHFRHETHDREVFQSAPVVNYPNDQAYTRITEFKYLTGQKHAKTSIVYEYPRAEGDPYYPIPRPENAEIYAKYKALADQQTNVVFCGRLANYRYYNMDQVVAQALATFENIAAAERVRPALYQPAVPSTTRPTVAASTVTQ